MVLCMALSKSVMFIVVRHWLPIITFCPVNHLPDLVYVSVEFKVTDGSNRDMDGAVDGRIKDPAGLAILVDSSNLASTGESTLSLAFIAAILTLAGLITLSPYAKRLRKIS